MISLFTPAPNDASRVYLSRIFGNMGGIFPTGEQLTLLGTMFKYFNGVILTVGALMVLYITITGVMITAHEGEFMGKKYHQLWTPLRTLMGIALLVPTASGYSLIQFVMMWVIVQGIGAADTLWNTVLGYVSQWGSPYAQITIPSTASSASLNGIWKGLVCNATAFQANPAGLKFDIPGSDYYCSSKGGCTVPLVWQPSAKAYEFGPSQGLCGSLVSCDKDQVCKDTPDALQCAVCMGQSEAIQRILAVLNPIAVSLSDTDYWYRSFYQQSSSKTNPDKWGFVYDYCASKNIPRQNCCVPLLGQTEGAESSCPNTDVSAFYSPYKKDDVGSASPEAVAYIYWPFGMKQTVQDNFMRTVSNYYTDMINDRVNEYIKAKQVSGRISDRLAEAADVGWIFAGSYYYIIGQMNNNNMVGAKVDFEVIPPSSSNIMSGYRNNNDAATVLANIAAGVQPSNVPGAETQAVFQQGGKDADNVLNVLGASDANPIAQLQMAGMSLLAIVQIVFTIMLGVMLLGGAVAFLNGFVLGTGGINPFSGAYIVFTLFIVPALFALLGLMIAMGGLLGVYVPLIPYTIFTFGAIGWMLSTIEAMVAGPLVALGILSPSGQHEIMGKAEPALMLLFSIFLRPSLMIFGLMSAMLLATVVATMVNKAFWTTVFVGIMGAGVNSGAATVDTGSAAGIAAMTGLFASNPLQGCIFLAAYVSVIVTAMNKCFSAIHVLPERVLTWISGQAVSMGEAEAAGEMKSGVTGAAGAARGGVGSAANIAEKNAPAVKKQADDAKEAKKAADAKKLAAGKGKEDSSD